jgi:hypothetical protein
MVENNGNMRERGEKNINKLSGAFLLREKKKKKEPLSSGANDR